MEDRSMRRIGILSFSSPGHYYPLTALGRRLQSRGHDVIYWQVAAHVGLPFVRAAAALPVEPDDSVPPVIFPWPHRSGVAARLRNRLGNAASGWILSGVLRTINQQRRAWGLPPARDIQSLFSK